MDKNRKMWYPAVSESGSRSGPLIDNQLPPFGRIRSDGVFYWSNEFGRSLHSKHNAPSSPTTIDPQFQTNQEERR